MIALLVDLCLMGVLGALALQCGRIANTLERHDGRLAQYLEREEARMTRLQRAGEEAA